MHWTLAPDLEFDQPLDDLPLHFDGFVYVIRTPSGQLYIGRKFLHSKRKGQIIESDWKRYCSSSKAITADIKANGSNGYTFTIIKLCKTRSETCYRETQLQWVHDVLGSLRPDGSRLYLNNNIASKWFVAPDHHTPETIERIRLAKRMITAETRAKIASTLRQRKGKQE